MGLGFDDFLLVDAARIVVDDALADGAHVAAQHGEDFGKDSHDVLPISRIR
ncbi:hypothetical protein LP420_38915 [Massilia sp. B-10]|nr:hypothetical protein LP420_38915 [Massilia sp. B-10]